MKSLLLVLLIQAVGAHQNTFPGQAEPLQGHHSQQASNSQQVPNSQQQFGGEQAKDEE